MFPQPTWKRVYGGIERDVATSVKALPDGGAIVCGSTGSFGTISGDIYVLRLDIDGERIWSTTVGGAGVQEGADVVQLPNGNFIVAGSTDAGTAGGYDGYAVCISADGQLVWERSYGTPEWDFLRSVDVDGDHILLAGQTFGYDPAGDLLLVKVDAEGGIVWLGGYGADGENDGGYVKVRSDGSYLLSGTVGDVDDADPILVAIASDGSEEWNIRLEEDGLQWIFGMGITSTGDALLTGYQRSAGMHSAMYLAKVGVDGDLVWSHPVSSTGDDWESRAVKELPDGRILLAGYTAEYGAGDRDMSLLILNANGDFISGPTYGGAQRDEAWSLDLASDGAYYIAGSTTSFGPGMESYFVIRSDGDTLNAAVIPFNDPVGLADEQHLPEVSVYPVPVASGGLLTINGAAAGRSSVVVHDLFGAVVRTLDLQLGRVRLPELSSGAYFIRFRSSDGREICRPILIE